MFDSWTEMAVNQQREQAFGSHFRNAEIPIIDEMEDDDLFELAHAVGLNLGTNGDNHHHAE